MMRLVKTEDLGIVFEEADEEIPAQLASFAVRLAQLGDELAAAVKRGDGKTAAAKWEAERERQRKVVASSWAGTLAANTERAPGAFVFPLFQKFA